VRDSQQHHAGKVGARRWIAGIMVLWGIASTCTMFATSPKSLYILRMLVGITEAGFLPGILLYLTWWFPAFRARANALFMIAMPVTMRSARSSPAIFWRWTAVEPARLAVAVPAGRAAVGGARRYGLVLPQRHAGRPTG
jgi:MFS family permease